MAGSVYFNQNVALDADGNPESGAKAYFYQTGTSTPVTVYSDAGLTTPHASPLVADSNGRFAAVYTNGSVQLKVTVTDSAGATLPGYPVDPALFQSSSASASNVAFTPTASISSTNVQAAIEEVDATAQAASTASDLSVKVSSGYVAPLYPETLTDLDAAVRTGFFTLSGTYDSTPSGDAVTISGTIEIVKRFYPAGSGILQRLSLSGTESAIWTRTGTGAGPTFGPWVRQIDTGQVSSSAENIAGTSTSKYPNVAGVKEMIDTHGGFHLVSSWTHSTDVSGVAFTDLGEYSSLIIVCRDLDMSATGQCRVILSTDNGATYPNTGTEYEINYLTKSLDGKSTASGNIANLHGGTTSARNSVCRLDAFNTASAPTISHGIGTETADNVTAYIGVMVAVASCNALIVAPSSGNLVGGTIYLLGMKGVV